ncbi:glutaredoxin family protein [Helcococcus kunzii]|uniref:Glutaredoxin-like protein, YruB-family n=1 Tax=Helcococcus kunzii ATCC 51366 TaxID=883114 RepID=H3NL97_9FIRM|nr:glutaredoxin family protein [Helcococcus kunzii]EHR36078.1 glutaredoxin-like protein, YruB-family [Helcococcus kunzii ATCC 51366]MCT1796652.1 glutaredoxin family protein [Helcococcus kunzii]MCT1988704.1 glutaredoxin family protein [Helcococcus kunzii]QUY64112.1 glutaredoxin family protein [Helcococcus kunzii]QZO76565.1 glutaredoxin family protein [Helcococcus kunzii]
MEKVVVYSSDTCPYCVAAKDFLKENKVDFVEKNVTTDTEARNELIEKGYRGVPVIVVGDEEIVGFDKPRLESLLNL